MELADQLIKQITSLQAALQEAEEGYNKEKEVIQRNFQELKDHYEHNTQLLLEEHRENEPLKEERQKTKTYIEKVTENDNFNPKLLEVECHNNKELMEKLKRKNKELADQLTKQETSLQAELQAAKVGYEKKKEELEKEFQDLINGYVRITQRLLKEQRENETLKEERQETKANREKVSKNNTFSLKRLEEEFCNKELIEKLKRKDDNMELADQLTKQVMSLQATLQSPEEGFKKEKEAMQRDFQELKDSYEHNTQLLLEEQRENEALKKERQERNTYIEKVTEKYNLNLKCQEVDFCNNKELMEKLKRKDENTELTDQLTKQVTSLQTALQAAEEGSTKEKKVIKRDFQQLKDSCEHITQNLLKEQRKNEALKEEIQERETYIEKVTEKYNLNLKYLEVERHNSKKLMEKLQRKDKCAELADQQVASLQAALQEAEEGFKKEKEAIQRDFQELKNSYEHNSQLLLKEQRENKELKEERQEKKAYIEKVTENYNLNLEVERHNSKKLMEKLQRKDKCVELADHQVASLQAALQAAEEGFTKEKEVIQRDFQELKNSYEHNSQLLLKEQRKYEALEEERQERETYIEKVTENYNLNLKYLEVECHNNNKEFIEKLKRKGKYMELADQQVASLQAALQAAEEGFTKEKEVIQRDFQKLKDSYKLNTQLLLEEQRENEALKKERQERKTYIENVTENSNLNLKNLEVERHNNKMLMEKLKKKDKYTELADQQVTSLQTSLQAAEEGFTKEKEVMQRDFQELKNSYEHNSQLLLKEQRENEALRKERQERKTYIEEVTMKFQSNLQNQERERRNNELMKKLKRKDENTELADQLTKQVTFLQATLQAAEEGFQKEKEVIQRDFQELKNSYEHITQLLLEEQRENEALREERQETLQAAKEKEELEKDLQELRDSYERVTHRLLNERRENEVLWEERQETNVYIASVCNIWPTERCELKEKVLREEEKQEHLFDYDLKLEKKEVTKCYLYEEGENWNGRRKWSRTK